MEWLRLWHDMPTDPKWRSVARTSGQPLATVIAAATFLLTNASANEDERGVTQCDAETVASVLDVTEEAAAAILLAMEGRVLDGGRWINWEKRQPKREDSSAERTRAYRERRRKETRCDAPVTQGDAPERDTDTELDTEKDLSSLRSDRAAAYAFEGEVIRIDDAQFRRWGSAYYTLDLVTELTGIDAWLVQGNRRENWFFKVPRMLEKKHQQIIGDGIRAQQAADVVVLHPDPTAGVV